MKYADVLLTLAEIAVAIAGFSGVVGVFGQTRDGRDSRVHATRLRNLVETGLLTAALCVLPAVVHETGVASPWRLASGLAAAGLGWSVATALLRFRRLTALGLYRRDHIASAFYLLACSVIAVLLAGALGLLGTLAATAYVACLVQPFGVCVLLFLRLLSAHFPFESE